MTTARTSRPIIFTAESVRAILAGTKTQTRRVAKLPDDIESVTNVPGVDEPGVYTVISTMQPRVKIRCPYCAPGDHLWVREAWAIKDCGNRVEIVAGEFTMKHRLQYVATDEAPAKTRGGKPFWWNKRSASSMPEWASRLTLEVTGVRVERVQDISHDDAIAEGMLSHPNWEGHRHEGQWESRTMFRETWDAINERRGLGWKMNPWVWAITFSIVK